MIPDLGAITRAHEFLRRRYGLQTPLNQAVVELAQREAVSLALNPKDEPAAIFFAFSRRARALGDAWAPLTDLLTWNQISALKLTCEADFSELRSLRVGVASRTAQFTDVRAWFASRMK